MKKLLCLLLCGAVLAGMLAGCATGETVYVPTGDGLTWDDGNTNPTETEGNGEVQALSLVYYPDRTLNPYSCVDFTNRALFPLLYQSLFIVNRDYQIEPLLCKRYTMSEDMRIYTFYMENATFSDGAPLTAADVVASLTAAKESDLYGGRFQHVTEILLSEDGGVTLKLNTACENLPLILDVPIIKENQLENPFPLGTGPYVLDNNSAGMGLLRRRSNWWCRADMTVTAPSIGLVVAESPAQIRDKFEFSDVELVCVDPGSDRYADYRCDFEIWDCENGFFLYLACNMDSAVFSKPEVRSKLTFAIDRDTLAESYYRNFARSAVLPASPLSPFYSAVLASRYGYDSVRFAQQISDSGLRDTPIVLMVNSDDSLRVRVARAIGQMISDCGLNVELKEVGGNAYLNALRNREYDLYLGQTRLSPNMDLSAFFAGTGALSYGGINDVAMYTLCRDSLANVGNYFTLHQTIMEDGRLCPILFRSYAVYATRGLLTGLTPSRDNVFYYSLGKTMEGALLKE